VAYLQPALGIVDHLRRRFVRFKLGAHLLEAHSESFNLFLLFGYCCSLLLHRAMFFEKLVEQHCVHLVVAHAVRFSFVIAHYQVRINLFHFFGHENEEYARFPRSRALKRVPSATWQQMKTSYASGIIGLREIARNMHIPEGTVLARAKREGWTRKIQNAKALAKRENASPAVTATEAVAITMQQRGERHLERMAGVSERGADHIETMDGPEILNSVDEIEKLDKVARRIFGLNDNPVPPGFTLNVLNLGSLGVQVRPMTRNSLQPE
jgi:hypothetical protein